MLARVLEPEAMDSPEEARAYDAMDHMDVNRRFAHDFLALYLAQTEGRSTGAPPGALLDVGTGTAQIPIELCRRNLTIRILGIDLARHMLDLGRNNVRRAGLEQRIDLRQLNAKALPIATGTFDAVLSNSIIHHIPDPALVLREMLRVLAPGGIVFVRDLVRPPSEAALQDLVKLHAGNANNEQRRLFAASLGAALSLDEVRIIVMEQGFAYEGVTQTSDRHWTWQAVKS